MPSLSPYRSALDYAYAPGMFPAMECLLHRPDCARRVLLHSKSAGTEGAQRLTELAAKLHVRVEEADRALSRISGKENCFAAAVFSKFSDTLAPNGPHVVLHNPSDCGNVGTILRTADAAGFDGALLSSACADLYSAKTLRATMGSVFRVPTKRTDDLAAALEAMKARGYAVVATELGGADFYAHCPHEKCVLVIGSEGRGVSAAVRDVATHHLALPMRGGAESLNAAVASGIMIYEMARKA